MKSADINDLESFLEQLRADGESIVQSIRKVHERYSLSLAEAKDAVHHSRAWESEREAHDAFHDQLADAWENTPFDADLDLAPDRFEPFDRVTLTGGPPELPAGATGLIVSAAPETEAPAFTVKFTGPDGADLGVHTLPASRLAHAARTDGWGVVSEGGSR